jgi:hypothetical protein
MSKWTGEDIDWLKRWALKLRPEQFRTLFIIATHSDMSTGECFVSLNSLIVDNDLHAAVTLTAVRELQDERCVIWSPAHVDSTEPELVINRKCR